MIAFACPKCSKPFRVSADKAGKKTKCPQCQEPLLVPRMDAAAAAPPATSESLPQPTSTAEHIGKKISIVVMMGAGAITLIAFGSILLRAALKEHPSPSPTPTPTTPVASAKPSPAEDARETVRFWLETQQKGNTGSSYWHEDIPHPRRESLYTIRSFTFKSADYKGVDQWGEDEWALVYIRVEHSNNEGVPVIKDYKVRMRRKVGTDAWYIQQLSMG
jgi:DNA-directed RNA polymerase subunit RPC12/RpoP